LRHTRAVERDIRKATVGGACAFHSSSDVPAVLYHLATLPRDKRVCALCMASDQKKARAAIERITASAFDVCVASVASGRLRRVRPTLRRRLVAVAHAALKCIAASALGVWLRSGFAELTVALQTELNRILVRTQICNPKMKIANKN